jgi:hypothetical protein
MASLQNAQIDQSYQGLIKTADNTSTPPFPPVALQYGDGTNTPISIGDGTGVGIGDIVTITSGTRTIDLNSQNLGLIGLTNIDAAAGTANIINGTYNFGLGFPGAPATNVDFTNATVTGLPGGGTPSHPARYFGTGTLATTFEGPYGFFGNDILFYAVYLNEGEEVSELTVEVGTPFTNTTTIGMALYDAQISTSTVEYVPKNKLLDLGTASPATAGVKTFTGSTYTATYSGTYFIALGYNGTWDGTFRQTDSGPRSYNTDNYYISTTTLGHARDFTPFEPIRYAASYNGTMPATFAASQSFANTSARLALMGKTEQNV